MVIKATSSQSSGILSQVVQYKDKLEQKGQFVVLTLLGNQHNTLKVNTYRYEFMAAIANAWRDFRKLGESYLLHGGKTSGPKNLALTVIAETDKEQEPLFRKIETVKAGSPRFKTDIVGAGGAEATLRRNSTDLTNITHTLEVLAGTQNIHPQLTTLTKGMEEHQRMIDERKGIHQALENLHEEMMDGGLNSVEAAMNLAKFIAANRDDIDPEMIETYGKEIETAIVAKVNPETTSLDDYIKLAYLHQELTKAKFSHPELSKLLEQLTPRFIQQVDTSPTNTLPVVQQSLKIHQLRLKKFEDNRIDTSDPVYTKLLEKAKEFKAKILELLNSQLGEAKQGIEREGLLIKAGQANLSAYQDFRKEFASAYQLVEKKKKDFEWYSDAGNLLKAVNMINEYITLSETGKTTDKKLNEIWQYSQGVINLNSQSDIQNPAVLSRVLAEGIQFVQNQRINRKLPVELENGLNTAYTFAIGMSKLNQGNEDKLLQLQEQKKNLETELAQFPQETTPGLE